MPSRRNGGEWDGSKPAFAMRAGVPPPRDAAGERAMAGPGAWALPIAVLATAPPVPAGNLFSLIVRAAAGDAGAQLGLGMIYLEGEVVPRDARKALRWIRRAAGRGHAEAEYRLGLIYGAGEDVEKDNREAVAWYRKAAEQGRARARTNLGYMYAI